MNHPLSHTLRELALALLSQMPFYNTKTYFIYFNIAFNITTYIKSCIFFFLQYIKIIYTTR